MTYTIVSKGSVVYDEAPSATAKFVDRNRPTIPKPDLWVLGEDGGLIEIWASIESVVPVSDIRN